MEGNHVNDQNLLGKNAAHGLRLFAVLALAITGWLGAVAPVIAQGGTSNVAIVATENGQSVYDACFVLVNFSNEGCDENRDGKITFQDVPLGTYTLRQTRDLGSGRSVPDSTIQVTGVVDSDGWERIYVSVTSSGSSSQGNGGMIIGATACDGMGSCWNEIGAQFTVTTEDGEFLGSCAVTGDRNDTSHVAACAVHFAFEPSGTVVVTLDLNTITPGYAPEENPIRVDVTQIGRASHDVVFHNAPQGSGQSGAVDIALITRDPADGALLTGTCYVLVGYSNVGCDENGDGQVTFADIPVGTYTVRQTQTPIGYPTINDHEITVESIGGGIPLGFVVRQAPEQNAANTRNVSVVLIDSQTGARVVSDICVELVGASNVGCDEDLQDGQIDFLDVSAGTHDIKFSNVPTSWQVLTPNHDGTYVTIDADAGTPTHVMIFFEVYVP